MRNLAEECDHPLPRSGCRVSRSARHISALAVGISLLITVVALVSPVTAAAGSYSAPNSSIGWGVSVVKGGIGGWAVQNNRPGSVTGVAFLFVQPTVACNSSNADGQDIDFVGIVANSNFSAVTGIGTGALCHLGAPSPVYYAGYTKQANTTCRHIFDGCVIPKMVITPGDLIGGSVSWAGGDVDLKLVDWTTSHRFSLNDQKIAGLKPDLGGCVSSQNHDIAKYSKVTWACFPTVSGKTGPIGMFSAHNQLLKMITTDSPGTADVDRISALFNHGASFTNTWLRSEPT